MPKLETYLTACNHPVITDSFIKADSVLNRKGYKNIQVSISGGADSDIMLDLCQKVGIMERMTYVWFDTGLEYEATKEHLFDLERKYQIAIRRLKAVKPIPLCCHTYGQPFLSKYISEQMARLQRHNFMWEDLPYETLRECYHGCDTALKWWCNLYDKPGFTRPSQFSIGRNKGLKEFIVENPPHFPISSKCCHYAKKMTSQQFAKQNGTDLSVTGVRKSEGGIRATAYDGCFSAKDYTGIATYRPLFWYPNDAKKQYEDVFQIEHSRCYTAYGMKRTGCVGCPYNPKILEELAVISHFEPKLYRAVQSIFYDSYEYTRKYREFVKRM